MKNAIVATLLILVFVGTAVLVYFSPSNPVLPPSYSYWGNMRGLFFTGDCFGHPDEAVTTDVGAKHSARFTCSQTCVVKGVYGEMVVNPEYMVDVKWGLQSDDGTGKPDGVWLGYWRGILDEGRGLHLFQNTVSLVRGQVYHIVLEVVGNPQSISLSYHAYYTGEKRHSYDWSYDSELAYLVYDLAKWKVVAEKGVEVVPLVCVVTEDEGMSFPIAGIDMFYVQARNFYYNMTGFPTTLYVDQLTLKLARVSEVGNVTIQLNDLDEAKILAETTFRLSVLPESTIGIDTWLKQPYIWNFTEKIRLEKDKDYELRLFSSAQFKVCIVWECQPYSSGSDAWHNDLGSFYGHNFCVTRLGQSRTGPSPDITFAFRTLTFFF